MRGYVSRHFCGTDIPANMTIKVRTHETEVPIGARHCVARVIANQQERNGGTRTKNDKWWRIGPIWPAQGGVVHAVMLH